MAEQTVADMTDGERKTVTALFADIKGSMELMEELDPEQARALIDPALKLMINAIHSYDGYVVQSTGDGIFALFGAPMAREDHPQRALYAALRLQGEIRRYSAKLREAGNSPIEARIGVNTGEVVVRSLATGQGKVEYTPIGQSTGLAARMQALAPAGSIATTDMTRRLCEGYFSFRGLGPARVKGISEAVNVHEVTGLGLLRTHFQASTYRGLTKFVGRQREMEILKSAAQQAQMGHGQIVAALAEPGIGKSRLFYEFKVTTPRAGWLVLDTFSVSHGKASAYLPLIELLHGYFAIEPSDDGRKRREKVNGKVLTLERTLEDTTPYLFSLLGIVEGEDPLSPIDAELKKRRTQEAIKRLLLRESLNQPLMVIFEDLHWIDGQTQGFLDLLADSIGTAKVLLLVNYRPEYSHHWNSKTYYTQLRLDPLAQDGAEEMLATLMGDSPELKPLKRVIIEKTEGTPFFIEEIVQALFEDGALVRNGGVRLTRPLAEIRMPPTVQAVLASRIDRLPAEQKQLLHTLAVLGREFSLELVQRVTQQAIDELEPMLLRLQTGEFIYEQPTTGDLEYTFKHALTQEVAYNSVLIERRKLLHERAGRALESMFADQPEEHVTELAHHYSRSADVMKALNYLRRAGQQAVQLSANTEAIRDFETALQLLHTLPNGTERLQEELALRLALAVPVMIVEGQSSRRVEETYARARELCQQLGDTSAVSLVLWGLYMAYVFGAEHRNARHIAGELRRLGDEARSSEILVWAHYALGVSSFWLGEFLPAIDHLQHGLNLYDSRLHHSYTLRYGQDPGIGCLAVMAIATWLSGFPDRALKVTERGLILANELSHPFSTGGMLWSTAWVRRLRGESIISQNLAETAISLCAQYRMPFSSTVNIMNGGALVAQGRAQEGIRRIHEGLESSRKVGSRLFESCALGFLVEAYLVAEQADRGLTVLSETLKMLDESDEHIYEAELYRLKGELLLQNNTGPAGPENCFRKAILIARRQQAKSLELRASMSLARLLASQNRRAEARAMLAEIYSWFTEGFDTSDLKEAKALLDELSI